MNKLGYILVAAAGIALAAYAFWPEELRNEDVHLHQGPAPETYTVHAPALEQRVEGRSVRIGTLGRPLDSMRASALWEAIDSVSAPAAKVVEERDERQLGAYGIDGKRGVETAGLRLLWGTSGGLGYAWDSRRVLCVPSAAIDRLDAAARRLDERGLLAGAGEIDRIACGGVRLERGAGGWSDRAREGRPGLDVRAVHVLGLIQRLALDSLDPATPVGLPALTLSLHASASAAERRLVFRSDGVQAWAALDDLPAQRLDAPAWAAWKAACDDLGRDVLLDRDALSARLDVVRLAAERGGRPWFTVDRRQASYRPGETDYDLSWTGGRERASFASLFGSEAGDGGLGLMGELCSLAVARAEPGPDRDPPSAEALRFRIIDQNGGESELTLDGERAWTPTHHGRLERPTPLSQLQPAALIDLALLDAPVERVSKVQILLEREPPRGEVAARAEDGAWTRTAYAPGSPPARARVDAVAVGRLARAFCAARASSARLSVDEDERALKDPAGLAVEVDLRLAPKAAGAPRMEIADERDTVPQDRGFAFYRDAAGAWRAIDVEGGVSYVVDEELAELARRPLVSDLAFPLVAGLVRRIEVARGKESYALARVGAGWTLAAIADDGKPVEQPADEIAVRRLLRDLGELRVREPMPKAAPLLPASAAATVVCVLPGPGGDEHLTLALAEPEGGVAEASVSSTDAATIVPEGRVRVGPVALDEVAPPRSHLVKQ